MFYLILFFLCPVSLLVAKPLDVQVESPYAILINAKSGAILYEKNARSTVFPASTTKIATALYVLKTMPRNLDDVVRALPECLQKTTEMSKIKHNFTLPSYLLEVDGSTAKLIANEEMSLEALLYGAMLCSGNDATNALAYHVSNDIPTFVEQMNEMVQELGCEKTHFCNPHGLHHPEHVSCAYDMALICKEALKYEKFRQIVGTVSYPRPKTNKQQGGKFINTNRLIHKDKEFYYPNAIGGKTGSTKKAKSNLVAIANDGKRELIAVIHAAPKVNQLYHDAIALFEAASQEKQERRLLIPMNETETEVVIRQANSPLRAKAERDIFLDYFPSEEVSVQSKVIWNSLALPISKGSEVGSILIIDNKGYTLIKEPLFATHSVDKSSVYKGIEWLIKIFYITFAQFAIIALLIICLFYIRYVISYNYLDY